jgi:hypothetical protein
VDRGAGLDVFRASGAVLTFQERFLASRQMEAEGVERLPPTQECHFDGNVGRESK